MATILVRYLYRKYKDRNGAGAQREVTAEPAFRDEHDYQNEESNISPGLGIPPRNQAATTSDTRNTKSSMRWKLTLSVALLIPIFLETLDYTVVATAQPHIASVFNRLDLQSYIGTSYLLSSTVFLPVFASVADIYGRHAGLQVALIFFLVGSALSTGAVAMSMMLIGRGIAGIGAAGLLTVVRTILADTRSLDDNNWQQTLLFVLFAIGFSVGPVIGGYLVAVSFRWIFAINLPCCAIAMILAFFLLRHKIKAGQPSQHLLTTSQGRPIETPLQKFLRMDWVGALLFIAAGVLLLLALNWGSSERWNAAKVIACFVVGGILMIIFLFWQHILEKQLTLTTPNSNRFLHAEPMIPLEVFRSFDVCAVQYASFISGMVMLVMFYFVAIFMTIVNGLSAAKAGVQLIFFAPGMGVGAIIAINAIKYLRQPRYPIVFGSVIIVIALGLIQMAMESGHQSQVNGFLAMTGVGVGLTAGPLAIQARFAQADSRVAAVTGLTLFFRSLGGTVGLAQCAAVLSSKVGSYLTTAVKSGALSASSIASLSSANASLSSIQSIDELPKEIQDLVRNAFKNGTRWAFISLIPWCAVSVFLTVFLSKIADSDKERRDQEEEKMSSGGSAEKIGAADVPVQATLPRTN